MSKEIPVIAIIAIILAIIMPLIGVIIGIIALVQINKTPEKKGKGLATASIIVGGILTLIMPLLIFIGMITYFGVLDPGTTIPERCTMSTGLICQEFLVTDNSLTIVVGNQLEQDIVIQEFFALINRGSTHMPACQISSPVEINQNGKATIELQNCNFNANKGDRINLNLDIKYTRTGITHPSTAIGGIFATIN